MSFRDLLITDQVASLLAHPGKNGRKSLRVGGFRKSPVRQVEVRVVLQVLQGPVRCLANSPTDKTFLTGGDDFKVRYVEMSAEALADGGMEGVDDD